MITFRTKIKEHPDINRLFIVKSDFNDWDYTPGFPVNGDCLLFLGLRAYIWEDQNGDLLEIGGLTKYEFKFLWKNKIYLTPYNQSLEHFFKYKVELIG